MKAKDILSRLPMGAPAAAPAEARPRSPASAPIPIVGEIETMHRGAVSELRELKAKRLITLELPTAQVDPGPYRDRDYQFLVDEAFEDLAESIRREGQLQPVLVRRRQGEPPFELIVGLRRLKACERLGIPVQAKEIEADDRAVILAMIAENELREDISAIERARQIKSLLDTGVLTQTEIASVLGRHKSLISRILALCDIPPAVIRAIGDPRAMTLRLGYSIAQLSRHPATSKALLAEADRLAAAENMTPGQRLEALVAAASQVTQASDKAAAAPNLPQDQGSQDRIPARLRLPVRSGRAIHVRDRTGGKPLLSLTTGGERAAPVLRVAPDLGRAFADELMEWAAARLRERGRDVEIGPANLPAGGPMMTEMPPSSSDEH